MRHVNLTKPELEYDDDDPEGFRAGMFRTGPQLGAKATGASLYDLPPGQAICPYHYECGEEEWLLVIEGRPTLRDPEGTHALEPQDLVFFPPGPDGAHQVRNDTAEPASVLMWSTVVTPSASVYPDSDKIGIWTQPGSTDRAVGEPKSGDGELMGWLEVVSVRLVAVVDGDRCPVAPRSGHVGVLAGSGVHAGWAGPIELSSVSVPDSQASVGSARMRSRARV